MTSVESLEYFNSSQPTININKIYSPKPKRIYRTINFKRDLVIPNLTKSSSVILLKNRYGNIDIYSIEEINQDFNRMNSKSEMNDTKEEILSILRHSNASTQYEERYEIKRPQNPFCKNIVDI